MRVVAFGIPFHIMVANKAVVEWLLEGDPSIRWQTMRDLLGRGERTVARERQRVAEAGWGARLLKLQDASGQWGGGVYTPKWTSTTYTLRALRVLKWASDLSRS
jgi:hypothetical protein